MEKGKIIVTGGMGYIGSHTAVELINAGYETVIVDNLSNSEISTLDSISKITGVKPHFDEVDLTDEKTSKLFFKKHNDAVALINFAALKAVGESVQKPIEYYRNNINVLLNCLDGMTENNINNLIFSSSATVYGLPNNLPITESEPTKRPTSPYGNTKKIAEEIIEDFVVSNSNFSAISLRYFNPIGAHDSGLIGELPTGIPNNLMPYITQTAIGIREKLMVFGNDYPTKDGTPIRDYIHVVDLAVAHVNSLERLLQNKQETNYEIFNLGTGNGYSVLEIVNGFESITGVDLNYEITNRREGDVPQLYAATNLAQEKLEWTAERGLDNMLSSSWKWEQNLRNKSKN